MGMRVEAKHLTEFSQQDILVTIVASSIFFYMLRGSPHSTTTSIWAWSHDMTHVARKKNVGQHPPSLGHPMHTREEGKSLALLRIDDVCSWDSPHTFPQVSEADR